MAVITKFLKASMNFRTYTFLVRARQMENVEHFCQNVNIKMAAKKPIEYIVSFLAQPTYE